MKNLENTLSLLTIFLEENKSSNAGVVIPYALRMLGDEEIMPILPRNKNIIQCMLLFKYEFKES